jgi:hypothetical protein
MSAWSFGFGDPGLGFGFSGDSGNGTGAYYNPETGLYQSTPWTGGAPTPPTPPAPDDTTGSPSTSSGGGFKDAFLNLIGQVAAGFANIGLAKVNRDLNGNGYRTPYVPAYYPYGPGYGSSPLLNGINPNYIMLAIVAVIVILLVRR